MSSLDEARKKIEERRSQQKAAGGGQDLWIRENDLVIAHFLCSGGESDPYFDTYVSHEYPAKGQGQWPSLKYCPVESGHDENYDCPGCKDGIKTKDRMIMWFWVYDILHSTLKQGESFPQVAWNNKSYFRREVNGPKVWDTSAWRESPLDDILMLGAQLGSLHKTRVNLMSTGSGMQKRFKLYMEPGSPPIDPAILEQAIPMIKPVVEILREQLAGVATVANPVTLDYGPAKAAAPSNILPYTPAGGGAAAPAYTPSAVVTPSDKKLF